MRVRLRGTCFMAPSSEPQAASAKPPSKLQAASFVCWRNLLILVWLTRALATGVQLVMEVDALFIE